jgi:AcrR family transcriptional regulator
VARPKRQDERRAQLVEATLQASTDLGLRRLSLSDVADRAGLTRGAVLYYYDDLDALLVEAHRAGTARYCDEREARVAQEPTAGRRLTVAIDTGLPSGPDDALMRILYEFDVLAGTSELHDDLVQAMYRRQRACYEGIVATGRAAGDFTPTMPDSEIALTMVALEDAFGLHITAGNALVTVADARANMRAVAMSLGCPPSP